MATKLIGRFYLKLSDSKNLIGEFSNNHDTCKRNYTESADRIETDVEIGKFEGEYFSTWHEENGGRHECILANLKITQKPSCKNIFNLEWQVVDGRNFWGEGMVCDGMLIGDYRNFKNP